jgi:hypothetical protein
MAVVFEHIPIKPAATTAINNTKYLFAPLFFLSIIFKPFLKNCADCLFGLPKQKGSRHTIKEGFFLKPTALLNAIDVPGEDAAKKGI